MLQVIYIYTCTYYWSYFNVNRKAILVFSLNKKNGPDRDSSGAPRCARCVQETIPCRRFRLTIHAQAMLSDSNTIILLFSVTLFCMMIAICERRLALNAFECYLEDDRTSFHMISMKENCVYLKFEGIG